MSKKKKNKVTRLTDRDYDNYIMSLKDSDVTHAIVPKPANNAQQDEYD